MRIHSFESLAAVDGDGLRYAVFLCGCPLRCAYCHNPDTWYALGTEYTTEELFKKIKRYKPYMTAGGGGVTFSGGEPLLQAKAINEIALYLLKEGINYALDTSGVVPLTDEVKRAIDNADLVICDLKFPDKDSFKKYAKGDFNAVLSTLEYLNKTGKRTWVRTVVVPNINDSKESIEKYVNIIKGMNNIERYQLLGFHTMGFFKYDNLEYENPLKDTPAMDNEKLAKLQNYADSLFKNSKADVEF